MPSGSSPSFEFKNQVSPRYIEPIFSRLEFAKWYSSEQLRNLLRAGGLDVEGSHIANYNTATWALAGLGEVKTERRGRSLIKLFRLTAFGNEILGIVGTNQELFYDLMHFAFYAAWHRSHHLSRARFWVYSNVCDALWSDAPAHTDSYSLTNRLQIECQRAFPEHIPAFPERSVRAVFPWLGALTPPFLAKCGIKKSQLCSNRRSYCTPQLFQLATDMVYRLDGLTYGTSMSIDERHVETICRACLLAPERFWEMADLTNSAINGFQIRKGQWGVSIALDAPPDWIVLPDFSQEPVGPEENLPEEEEQE